jgi:dihydrofolate reductase
MRKLFLFMAVSVDGFFEGLNHDLSWHNTDEEFVDFAIKQLDTIDTILFGRVTYQMMAEFWPSDTALAEDPETAQHMNDASKIVFSHTLNQADWQNTTLIKEDAIQKIKKLKAQPGKDLAIFGSSNLCANLINQDPEIIDEYRIMIMPTILGQGTRLFEGLQTNLKLTKTQVREFGNGNVLVVYQPAKAGK